jgi:hypothetical protein
VQNSSRAVELDANDLRANYQLGLVYAKLGERKRQRECLPKTDDLRTRQRNQESVIRELFELPTKLI